MTSGQVELGPGHCYRYSLNGQLIFFVWSYWAGWCAVNGVSSRHVSDVWQYSEVESTILGEGTSSFFTMLKVPTLLLLSNLKNFKHYYKWAPKQIISARNYYACPQSYLQMILSWFWGSLSNNSYMSGLHPVWQYGAILRAGWRQRYPGHTTHTEAHPIVILYNQWLLHFDWMSILSIFMDLYTEFWSIRFSDLMFTEICLSVLFHIPSPLLPAPGCQVFALHIFCEAQHNNNCREDIIIITDQTVWCYYS